MSAISSTSRKPEKLDPGFFTRTSQIQLLYGIWVNMALVGIGLALGFTSVQVWQLLSPDSDIPVTRSEASWIASVLPLFSPIGCLISGYLMDRIGRRIMIIMSEGPMFMGWLYTYLAKSSKHIIIGRAITGIGCGMAIEPPRIFCTEISLPNMRGVIGAFPALAISLGICIQVGLGQYITWQDLCISSCVFTFINLILFILLPETPYYILKTKNVEEARKNLEKFRGLNYDIEKEMRQFEDLKIDDDIRKLTLMENLWALFKRSSCKPFSLVVGYIFIAHVSGTSCILMWSMEILVVAKSSYDIYTGFCLLAVTGLVVGIITSGLLFRVGRKPLAIISAGGVCCISFTIGFYLTYYKEPSLVPQICFMVYIAFASLGYYTLPFLMASELYPLQVRGILDGITISVTSLFIFVILKLYPLLIDNLGLNYTMIMFGACSLVGVIFLYFLLPETKELTLQEIEEYYNELRPSLVSQRRILTLQSDSSSTTSSYKSIKSKSSLAKKSKHKSISDYSTGMPLVREIAKKRLEIMRQEMKPGNEASDSDHSLSSEKEITTSLESLAIINKLKKSKESHSTEESVKIKEPEINTKNEISNKSTESIKSKTSLKTQNSIMKSKSKESVRFMDTKEDKNQPSKNADKDIEKTKDTDISNETEINIETKNNSATNTENKGDGENPEDEKQPSTSKK